MQDVKIEEKKNHCNFPRTIDFRRQLFHSLIEKKLLFSNNKERLSSRHGRARSTTVGVHLKLLQKKKKKLHRYICIWEQLRKLFYKALGTRWTRKEFHEYSLQVSVLTHLVLVIYDNIV